MGIGCDDFENSTRKRRQDQFAKKQKAEKEHVQKSGYFARSAKSNDRDLQLIKNSAQLAAKCALDQESGLVGMDMDDNGELLLIDFNRIKGEKPFDYKEKWFVDILTSIKRIQASYNENNGNVLPGYLPSVGFAGGLRPTLGYTLGSQADIRYESARQGWLTGFPNFNQPFTKIHNNRLTVSAQWTPYKLSLIHI